MKSTTKARYALVKTDTGRYYVQETDSDGELVSLCDADGETVNLGNAEWSFVRDLGPVTGDTDDFHAAVAACPELSAADGDTDCQICEIKAEQRTCDECGTSAVITDCGHYAQPRPIAAGDNSGANMHRTLCEACAGRAR